MVMTLKVSLLLDGQLPVEDTAAALEELAADAQQRDRYTQYALAGDILRGVSVLDDGFSQRIFERMKREAARMEPGYDPLAD
jgi:negative regulator of sigma E activity